MIENHPGSSVRRALAVLGAAAMMLSLLPLVGTAQAQEEQDRPLSNACPFEPPASGFRDRGGIPAPHLRNVDCAAFLNIVQGFADNTYRPRLLVRRDQIASFISLTLDAAGVLLPTGDDRFTDIAADSPHRPHINRLAQVGIIQGGPGNLPPAQFGPGLRVRRDSLASFLMRAAGYAFHNDPEAFTGDFDDAGAQRFTDVPPGNVHFGNVNAAAHFRLAEGIGDGLYRPRSAASRDQIASFTVRLLNFLETRPAVELRLLVEPAETHVGESVTATATLTRDGEPLEGVDVAFTAAGGADPGSLTAPTDADGEAVFEFTATQVGSVPVTARVTVDGQPLVATATVNVTGPPTLVLGLVVDRDLVQAGAPVTGTATVTRNGQPVQGVDVVFSTVGPADAAGGTIETDADGRARFPFRGTEAGSVALTATLPDQELSRTVTVTVTPRMVLEVSPEAVTVDETVTVTATARITSDAAGNTPISGDTVEFTAAGAPIDPSQHRNEPTGPDGRAVETFTFRPTQAGTITVTADAVVDGQQVQTTAQITVTANSAAAAMTLPPARGGGGPDG